MSLNLPELFAKFPDDRAAESWFEEQRWADGPVCPDCGSCEYGVVKHPTMPYRCRACRKHFSVRKGTIMQSSKLGYRAWAVAIYLHNSEPKGISSVRLAKYLGVHQSTAWHMLHRIREAFPLGASKLSGTVEVDETYIGGKQKNRHARKRRRLSADPLTGKRIAIGAVERGGQAVVQMINGNDINTLTRFVERNVRFASTVYTDDHGGYNDLSESYRHRTVNHSRGQYVHDDGTTHTNTIEGLWSMVKRSYMGTHHWWSVKHMNRYLDAASGRYNLRRLPALKRMAATWRGMDGKRLRYRDLVA